jgi:hypothetical protein
MKDTLGEKMLYFAYGSNMLSKRLRAPERAPSAVFVGIGFVCGYRLTFDKVSSDGSGKCDIEAKDNSEYKVYGVLFEIIGSEKTQLDRAEGLGEGYREERIEVITLSGPCDAFTYVAAKKEPALLPYHWYKALVIAGATEHNLPQPYIEWLRTLDSKPDANIKRGIKNESLLLDS